MKIMKTKFVILSLVVVMSAFLSSCEKEAKLEITINELGSGIMHDNTHTAQIGSELHVEADVIAEAKIDVIRITIHPESGSGGWELDTVYTKFRGLKNCEFHEHLDIDSIAEPGMYHFHFIVTDQKGNQTTAEAELQLVN